MWSYTEEENDFVSHGVSSPKDYEEIVKEVPEKFLSFFEDYIDRREKYVKTMWDRYSI